MYPHHTESIRNVTEYFQRDSEALALLLCGSIAHGFEDSTSDVDVMILVPDENYRRRFESGNIHFYNKGLCTYEGGYVDGKYSSLEFIKQVAAKGSEPARFAFEGSQILFSRLDGLEDQIRKTMEYPVHEKAERIKQFYAQFEAWHWYCGEALKKRDSYLLGTSIGKFVLFGGRLILAHNEMLYPYHKWFLKVLERAKDKPENLLAYIDALISSPTTEKIEAFYGMIKNFRLWVDGPFAWPAQFMLDSELNWMNGNAPVDDL